MRHSRPDRARARLRHRRVAVVLTALTGWLTIGVAGATPAAAHAALISSDPVDGARLDAVPDQVTVTFSEPVDPRAGHLQVLDEQGEQVHDGDPAHPDDPGHPDEVDRTTLSVPLRAGLGSGSYVIRYAVVSADSHPLIGGVAFVVGSGPLRTASGAVADSTGTDPVLNAAFTLARWACYGAVALLGGLVFALACWPGGRPGLGGRGGSRVRSLVRAGCALGAAGTGASLLLQGPYASGQGMSALFEPELLTTTLAMPYGRLLCLRLAALVVLGVVCGRLLGGTGRAAARAENVAMAAGFAVLISFAAAGHAVTSDTPTLAVFADVLHLLAMSVWLGGLVVLLCCLLPTGGADELSVALPRFSRLAAVSVGALAVTGTYQALSRVDSAEVLWATGYGRTLLLKLATVAVLLALGNAGRLAVRRTYRPRVHALGPPEGQLADTEGGAGQGADRAAATALLRGRLRASVAVETAVAAVVLALTAVLVAQSPTSVDTDDDRAHRATARVGGVTVDLTVRPARTGPNEFRLDVSDGAGHPNDPHELTVTADHPDFGRVPVPLRRTGPGRYEATGVALPRAGQWTLTLRVRVSLFDEDSVRTVVPIRE